MKKKPKICLVIIVSMTLICCQFNDERGENLDSSKWFADTSSRYKMADDVIQSKLLIDKDSNGVKEILGNPTDRNLTTNRWFYPMGTSQSGLGILLHTLSIRFDSGRVTKVDHIEIAD
jgi:hypothetical protein